MPDTSGTRLSGGPAAAVPQGKLFSSTVLSEYQSGVSIRKIAVALGSSRSRIRKTLEAAGVVVAARGRGRTRPDRRGARPEGVREILLDLYVDRRMSQREVAVALGVPEHRVRTWLREADVQPRSRGRANREDRHRPDRPPLADLYVDQALTAGQVGHRLEVQPGRVLAALHEQGLPVRVGNGSAAVQSLVVLDALYADEQVTSALARHGIAVVPEPGPLHVRLPTPARLSKAMLAELYVDCGLSVTHIEMLTGQPADTVRHHLRQAGVPLRGAGGLSPFIRRTRGLASTPDRQSRRARSATQVATVPTLTTREP